VLVFGGGGGLRNIAAGDMAGERALDWGLYLLILLVAYLLGVFHKQKPRYVRFLCSGFVTDTVQRHVR
jgi:hypothetical protein